MIKSIIITLRDRLEVLSHMSYYIIVFGLLIRLNKDAMVQSTQHQIGESV